MSSSIVAFDWIPNSAIIDTISLSSIPACSASLYTSKTFMVVLLSGSCSCTIVGASKTSMSAAFCSPWVAPCFICLQLAPASAARVWSSATDSCRSSGRLSWVALSFQTKCLYAALVLSALTVHPSWPPGNLFMRNS